MDEKYLWPLVGVALGSLLTFVTARLKDNEARRGRIGRLLMNMLNVRTELAVVLSLTSDFQEEFLKDVHSYERLRKRVTQRLLQSESTLANFRSAIDELSSDYPLESVRFQGSVDMLLKLRAATFETSANIPEVYIHALAAHEVVLEVTYEQLEKQIKKLAWMHGRGTFVRVWLDMRGRKKRQKRGATSTLMRDAFAEIDRAAQDPKVAEWLKKTSREPLERD